MTNLPRTKQSDNVRRPLRVQHRGTAKAPPLSYSSAAEHVCVTTSSNKKAVRSIVQARVKHAPGRHPIYLSLRLHACHRGKPLAPAPLQ